MSRQAKSQKTQPWLLALAALACAPRLPGPPLGAHQDEAPATVPYPPPVPHPIEIPTQPDDDAVWVDPHWTWGGASYRWTEGGWVFPAPGSYYALPLLVRLRTGRLVHYGGHWHGGTPRPAPPQSDGGTAPP